MQNVFLVLQAIIAFVLVISILLQKSAQDGGGLTGGGSTMGGLFTARGSANLLSRTTAFLGTVFILNSLFLGYLASGAHQNQSLIDQITPVTPLTAPAPAAAIPPPSGQAPETPAMPAVPLAK